MESHRTYHAGPSELATIGNPLGQDSTQPKAMEEVAAVASRAQGKGTVERANTVSFVRGSRRTSTINGGTLKRHYDRSYPKFSEDNHAAIAATVANTAIAVSGQEFE